MQVKLNKMTKSYTNILQDIERFVYSYIDHCNGEVKHNDILEQVELRFKISDSNIDEIIDRCFNRYNGYL